MELFPRLEHCVNIPTDAERNERRGEILPP